MSAHTARDIIGSQDPCLAYRTTRAVLLDRLGDPRTARAELAAALRHAPPLEHEEDRQDRSIAREVVRRDDLARAHMTAGLFAYHDGDLDLAARELQAAHDLLPTAASAHALGAVFYRRGDVAAASQYEARSVELEPTDLRYRWSLVISLLRLGRDEEAREHALAAIRQAPDDPRQHARLARLFKGARRDALSG